MKKEPLTAASLIPISRRALSQRVARALAKDGKLYVRRGGGFNAPSYDWIVDKSTNETVRRVVNLEDLGKELGVLKPYERLETGIEQYSREEVAAQEAGRRERVAWTPQARADRIADLRRTAARCVRDHGKDGLSEFYRKAADKEAAEAKALLKGLGLAKGKKAARLRVVSTK